MERAPVDLSLPHAGAGSAFARPAYATARATPPAPSEKTDAALPAVPDRQRRGFDWPTPLAPARSLQGTIPQGAFSCAPSLTWKYGRGTPVGSQLNGKCDPRGLPIDPTGHHRSGEQEWERFKAFSAEVVVGTEEKVAGAAEEWRDKNSTVWTDASRPENG